MRMKLCRIFAASVVLLPLLFQEIDSQSQSSLSSGLMLLGLLGGFFLGQMALSAFIVILMAIIPPDEARSLSRISRSVLNDPADSYSPNRTFNKFTMETESTRSSRFLSELLRSDPLNCMPKVMCELSSAQEPNMRTDTINDYKFLMKEMLQSDDKDETRHPSFRAGSQKPSKRKKKPLKKDDDSSDESVSKQSDEQNTKVDPNEAAELMELEEEDAIEEKAWTDLIDEDPGDIGYALADMKKKAKVQEMVHKGEFDEKDSDESAEYGYLGNNALSYRRNLEILEKHFGNNLNQGIFRTSRAFQDSFVHRKQRELKQTKDIYDRVRIAAEVANITRSARKCRALFEQCPIGGSGINKMVNNLRKVIVGTPLKNNESNRKNSKLNVEDLQAIVAQMQPPNVKVTLNIGNDPTGMGQVPMMSYPYYSAPTVPKVIHPADRSNSNHLSSSNKNGTEVIISSAEETTETNTSQQSFETSSEETTTPPTSNYSVGTMKVLNNTSGPNEAVRLQKITPQIQSNPITRKDPHTNNVLTSSKISKPHIPSTQKHEITHNIQYKDRLQEASKLIKDLQKSSTKKSNNFPLKQNPIYDKVRQQLQDLIHKIDPKGKIKTKSGNSDSEESDESSEELKPLMPIHPSKWTRSGVKFPLSPAPQFSKQPRITFQDQKTSWMGSLYDVLFRDKQTSPLPRKTEHYIPSAQRHALRSSIWPPPMYNPDTRINNYGRFDPPFANTNNYYPPIHEVNLRSHNQLPRRKSKAVIPTSKNSRPEPSNKRNFKKFQNPVALPVPPKPAVRSKVRRPIKYKTCCSKSKPKNRSG